MTKRSSDGVIWIVGILFAALAMFIGYELPRHDPAQTDATPQAAVTTATSPAKAPADKQAAAKPFAPPEGAIPDTDFGKMAQLGAAIFSDTQTNAREFVGNALQCANCHLDGGRLANSAPLWAAYVAYPAYRDKNGHVNTFQERVQGCFRFSMNGKAPPLGSKVLVALESYAYYLAKGAPTGVDLPGRGYPKVNKVANIDSAHGQQVYEQKCALCHGADGQGQSSADGAVVFPPLWGARSYNWGAGMESITNAAGFIKANMPLSQGNTLTDQEAWDVAAFVNGHERPQDPRFEGSVAETRKKYHDSAMSLYGQKVNGVVLGENPPPGGQPAAAATTQ